MLGAPFTGREKSRHGRGSFAVAVVVEVFLVLIVPLASWRWVRLLRVGLTIRVASPLKCSGSTLSARTSRRGCYLFLLWHRNRVRKESFVSVHTEDGTRGVWFNQQLTVLARNREKRECTKTGKQGTLGKKIDYQRIHWEERKTCVKGSRGLSYERRKDKLGDGHRR